MLKYVLKRVLIFIPTLFVITLIGFVIALNAPGDPVDRMVTAAQSDGSIGSQSVSQIEERTKWRKKLGLDLPVFYFALSKLSYPDTLYKIYDKTENEALSRLTDEYGNWPEVSKYIIHLGKFYKSLVAFRPDTNGMPRKEKNDVYEVFNTIKFEALSLKSSYHDEVITFKINNLHKLMKQYVFFDGFNTQLKQVDMNYNTIKQNSSAWKNYVPRLIFYGIHNQYHRWVFGDGEFTKGIVCFDFGTSYQTKQAITLVIKEKIGWSLFFSLVSIVFAYLISIPLGVKAARNRGGTFDKVSSVVLFMMYSLPSFFIGVLLLITFANPDVLNIFPASGVKPAEGYPDAAGFFEKVKLSFPYLILPLVCYTYSSLAFLSRLTKGTMTEVVQQDYIRTARAKGLDENTVIWKHAFRNSLLPIITVFANIFPAAIGGSVILETIFTIPGMGFESFLAIQTQNYPMIIAILTITGVLTLLGYLVSDILYAVADPRISFK